MNNTNDKLKPNKRKMHGRMKILYERKIKRMQEVKKMKIQQGVQS